MPRLTRRGIVATAVAAVPVVFIGVFFIWPLLVTAHRAIAGGPLAGQESVIPTHAIASAALTTLTLASVGTATTLAVGLPATWALFRRPFPGARLIAATLTAPFVLPTVVVALAFLTVQRDVLPALGWRHGVPAIIAALAFFNVAVVVRTVGPALAGLDERLIAAARTLGASPVSAARTVIWPAVRRAVWGATAVTFLFCATSFALVLVLGGTRVQTLETAAYQELTAFLDLRGAALIALVQACLIAVVAAVVSMVSRRGAGPVTQTAPVRLAARARNVVPITVALLPAVVLVAVPIVALVRRSLLGASGYSFDAYRALAGGEHGIAEPLVTSVWIALIAAAVAMVVAAATVAAAALHPGARWVQTLSVGPLAVSSIVVGVGLLVALAVPLRSWGHTGIYVLLIAAQALVAVPLVVRILAPALEGIDPRLRAAAATLGASPLVVVWRVVVPRMRGAIASACGLAFAVAVGEFGASVFLARPAAPTLPTTIVRLLGRPGADNLATASAGAVVLAVLAGGVMMLADGSRRTP